ncbi:hypothetical protein INT48_003670, partial [Thamnidium elegans]
MHPDTLLLNTEINTDISSENDAQDAPATTSDATSSVNKDEVSTVIRNTHDEDEEENLIPLYKRKIRSLARKQLESDDLEEIARLHKFISQFNMSIQQLESDNKKETNNNKNNNNKINNKKIDIPIFQLVDEPATCKSDNKPSYDNAEMFVSTFEMILDTNDVNINKCWKKYLLEAFLFSKNEKHHRWYTNNINPLSEKTSWDEIKEKLIDRFGNSANAANNIEKYLDLKQGQQKSIRDYMDRYSETYRRLPNNKQPSDAIEAMEFIKSLLTKAREE